MIDLMAAVLTCRFLPGSTVTVRDGPLESYNG